ncbi:type IV pilus twitching motility protein PilT [Facilibium subflavum]|uniref:type IV pilus twitching motility protein PilT n=1 Tax=Facilibium subflavum TaxID=2219058 RepID=UPI000E650313|nr:ATPase, T2SS/T4P/T4SS family [Facilibium subflavum]
MQSNTFLLQDEPPYFLKTHYQALLIKSAKHHISDLTVQSNTPVFGTSYGRHQQITKRSLSNNEVEDFVNLLYGSNAAAKVLSGTDIDFSYTENIDNTNKIRFRVNASLVNQYEKFGLQVSMRLLSTHPPDIESLGVPQDIYDLSFIKQGVVLVCGATGSGKSTLLASMMLQRAQKSKLGEKIITFESPIEYILPTHINTSVTAQSELPRCLPDFAYAVRNALRRTPTAIMVGEARDQDTISAVIEAALTGHSVFSTLHSQSVTQAINRLLTLFPKEEKMRIYYDFFSTIQGIIWQRLVPCTNGKRVALREYLIIDDLLRNKLISCDLQNINNLIVQTIKQRGTSVSQHAKALFDQGVINKQEFEQYA